MRIFPVVLLLTSVVAAFPSTNPTVAEPPTALIARQQAVVTPVPCKDISPPPTEWQTKSRFVKFGYAFLVQKNLTRAFEYIDSVYINNNPFADDGPNAALDFLGPVWPSVNITVRRLAFKGNMGWLNYNASGIGEIVDRFRWENGCIREHWDIGEVFPTDVPSFTFPISSKKKAAWGKQW